jgi:phenol/toluene 2-monooxygenase (NADH) P4/A4
MARHGHQEHLIEENNMAVAAIKEYIGENKDSADKFRGALLVYVGWDRHLMFAAPFCFPLPPEMPFKALVGEVMAGSYSAHPDWAKIDWSKVSWLKSGKPFAPDFEKSLAENGVGFKDALRFSTPGLNGIQGSCS